MHACLLVSVCYTTGFLNYTGATNPGQFIAYVDGYTSTASVTYWILQLGPLNGTTNQYDYSVVSDSNGLSLFILAQDIATFDLLYKDSVLSFVIGLGFDPIPMYHGEDCVYQPAFDDDFDDANDDSSDEDSGSNGSKQISARTLLFICIPVGIIVFFCLTLGCAWLFFPRYVESIARNSSIISSIRGSSDLSHRFITDPEHVKAEMQYVKDMNKRHSNPNKY